MYHKTANKSTNHFLTFIVLLSIILFNYISSFSQSEFSIKWGKQIKSNDIEMPLDFSEKGSLWSAGMSQPTMGSFGKVWASKELELTKITSLGSIGSQNTIKLIKDKKNTLDFEYFVKMKRKTFVFTSFRDKKTKKYHLYVQELNTKSCELSEEKKEIAEIDFSGRIKSNAGSYVFQLSKDSSHLGILKTEFILRSVKDPYTYDMIVFDHHMKKVWSKKHIGKYSKNTLNRDRFIVTNKGNIVLLNKVYNSEDKGLSIVDVSVAYDMRTNFLRSKNDKFVYEIIAFMKNGVIQEHQFKDTNLLSFTCDINDNHFFGNAYYGSIESHNVEGGISFKYDLLNGELVFKHPYQLDKDLFIDADNIKEKKLQRIEKGLENGFKRDAFQYVNKAIIKMEEGFVSIGENIYTYSTYHTGPDGSSRSTTYYVTGDIILHKFSETGELEWTKIIHKSQIHNGNDKGLMSFVYFKENNDIRLFFNDHSKNYDPKVKEHNYAWHNDLKGKASLVSAFINTTGEVNIQEAYKCNSIGDPQIVKTKNIRQINDSTYLLHGTFGINQYIGKLKVN